MPEKYEVVWNGRDELAAGLDRDYAAMRGEGWDLIWEPQSPLTTPWADFTDRFARHDPNTYVHQLAERVSRGASVIMADTDRLIRNALAREQALALSDMSRRGTLRRRHISGRVGHHHYR